MVDEEHKTVVKGTFWGLAGGIILKLVSFIYLIIIARLFTQGDVGTFYLATSILGIAAMFSDLGLSYAFYRYIPFFYGKGEAHKAHMLLTASYVYSGILSLVMGVFFFFSAGWFSDFFGNPSLALPVKILSAYLFSNTFMTLNAYFLLGRKKVKENNLILSLQNLLKLVLTVILFFAMGSTAEVLALAFAGSFVLAAIASFFYVKKDLEKSGLRGDGYSLGEQFELLREVVSFGLMLSLVLAFWSLILYMDRIMIGYLLPESAIPLAIYGVATTLAILVTVFPNAVSTIFFPMLSELYGKEKNEEMAKLSKSAFRWTLLLMVPVTMLLVSFPESILQMFYGSAYVPGAAVLAIFSIGLFIRSMSHVQNSILAAHRIVKIELYVTASAAIANVVLNFLLIPHYGIEGAALASTISFAVITILMSYYCRKLFGFGFPKDSYKPLLAGILALIIIFAAKRWLLGFMQQIPTLPELGSGIEALVVQKLMKLVVLGILFLIACAVYMLALMLLKSFKQEDSELLSSALRKVNTPNGLVLFAESMIAWGKE